jgi:dihydropteroate synthase-like protein
VHTAPDAAARRLVFVTGKLAEPALRRVLAELAPRAGFEPAVAVLPITVAALMTTDWAARHLQVPPGAERVILPGFCRGDAAEVAAAAGVPAEHGPKDLRDLPEFFGHSSGPPPGYGGYDIDILAEINHVPRLSRDELLALARRHRADGADVIDLGCDPGATWAGVGDAVKALRDEGLRVSMDSLNVAEIAVAAKAGVELVLSVNGSNRHAAADWGVEVVAIPDTPADLGGLDATLDALAQAGVPFRIDPVLEPIGFGFAVSLGRYLEVRRRYPEAAMLMGVGNLTELTDVDSAGVNVLLAGFCQELGVRSVLTTEVINWCRSCVRELDLARRLVHYAVRERVLPKKLEPDLVLLRDPKLYELGAEALCELASRITDRNYRLFAERGEIHIINGQMHLHGADPFSLFAEVERRDAKMDPAHAFYLGYELAKAVTALTLGKTYTQDQALRWGFLTAPEGPHHAPPTTEGP